MKIAIIGAGFTGLAAGLKLIEKGHEVTIFEKDSLPGGLALGFENLKWQWSLEKHYHHWFTNDTQVLKLAKKIKYPVVIKRPKTSAFINNNIYKLDSPLDILKFDQLNILQRLRMGIVIALLKYNPFWKPLEKYKASASLPILMGKRPYRILWEPLLKKKFGYYTKEISLAWFWARIAKRTPSLAYPKGGFLKFANALTSSIENKGGKILFKAQINKIISQKNGNVKINNKTFDKAIVTLPSFIFTKIAPQLPENYKKKILRLKGLGAINLVLRLKKPFLKDHTYWLNICDEKFPLTAIVEHTNFMDKKYYNNENLVYLGNYLPHDHPFMHMDKNKLLKIYDPLLKKINKNYKSEIIDTHLFSVPFAQPVIPINYSKLIPAFKTPLKNIYLANIQQVYPWDRGTNYAVELGDKVGNLILKNDI
ncbi:MAG: FAD-dependent oxidoreductase [Candidatus Levybacteria bacterium]|nr:FAD-dependent oxidoreductase [Candidatus Levybacteria bacterium]